MTAPALGSHVPRDVPDGHERRSNDLQGLLAERAAWSRVMVG